MMCYKNIPVLTFMAAQYCRVDSVMAIKQCVSTWRNATTLLCAKAIHSQYVMIIKRLYH